MEATFDDVDGDNDTTTLTLKRVPKRLVGRLKTLAQQNRRSVNGQAIVMLEGASAQAPERNDALADIAEIHAMLAGRTFDVDFIDAAKLEGRK